MASLKVRCCIVGGGPAGMMLGYLLSRAGIEVAVLEKHADFFRDFRGDTIHPSTLDIIHELGLLEEFLKLPHQEVRKLVGWVGDFQITVADFTHVPSRCPFIAMMPQWDFLNFLAEKAKVCSTFQLKMQADVTGLIEDEGIVRGVQATTPDGPLDVHADLVIGADGRHSTVRAQAGLVVESLGAPMDVFWLRISRRATDPHETFGRFDRGKILAMINRVDYWQCGFVFPKGSADVLRARGLQALKNDLAELAPFLSDRLIEIRTWDDARLLTVSVDRLHQWYRSGLLCIGDAAHAMSPVGGVGINLAIQDAVATANLLTQPLREGRATISDLSEVQMRRELPTRLTQRLQLFIQNNVIQNALQSTRITSLPWFLRLAQWIPVLTRIPARIVGIGFRPEHIRRGLFPILLLLLLFPYKGIAATEPVKASIVLTAKENGLESQSEFYCSGKIHGYLRLPGRQVGKHLLESIWTLPTGKVLQHTHIPIDFPSPGRSTAYVWLVFPERPVMGSLDPAADQDRLSFNGPWKLDVQWDEKPLVSSTFSVTCQ